MALRARGYRALAAHLSDADALDLEHACHVAATLNGAPYARFLFRALYELEAPARGEAPAFAQALAKRGGLGALGLPDAALHGTPCLQRAAVSAAEAERREAMALLDDLTAEGRRDLPEAGVKCSRCSSTDVSFEFSQTRSADEGTTVFCYCTRCKKRWKM